ncbi:MAG: hypothetical protein FGM15_00590 [Chthoniobacterales bacterium]|nr:hypothetical protein [Chthoniobacterales bacterium]
MNLFRGPVLMLVFSLGLAGCALFGKKKNAVPEATLPPLLGRVIMVDAEHRFVLLDSGASSALAPGAQVVTFRDKRRTSVLRTTGESQPPYIALAIVAGEPALGDQAALEGSVQPAQSPQPQAR